jgi:hypothetical protein
LGRSGAIESVVSEQILFVASPGRLQRLNKVYTHLIAVIKSCSDEKKPIEKYYRAVDPSRPCR